MLKFSAFTIIVRGRYSSISRSDAVTDRIKVNYKALHAGANNNGNVGNAVPFESIYKLDKVVIE